jgi:HAD superfamily hydrolase (TIGR01509 family)
MPQHSFDAIIFDHDGTLIDTESPDIQACQMLYDELGADFDPGRWAELVAGSMDGYDILFDDLIQWSNNGLNKEALWTRLRALWKLTYERVVLMPGVKRLLPQLHAAGYPLGIASASDRKWIVRWLTAFDLRPYFQVIASGDDVSHNKPAPDVYLFAAAQLGVEPERCLVFEDSLAGVQAAKSAGMVVIAVPNIITRQLDFSHADAVIEGLAVVTPEWIVELGARFIVM